MKALKKWWKTNQKRIMTVGIVIAILILFWCCYYAVYSHIKGENPTVTKLNLLFGSSGEEITIKEEGRKEEIVTFLIGGIDRFQYADVLIMAVFNKEQNTLRLLSVPKNTLGKSDRNNKQLCISFSEQGIEGLKKELKQITGLPVDRYVLLKHEGFEQVVDALGGVNLQVPMQMDYEDDVQGLAIHLSAGEQTLDGKNALDYVRFCGYSDGDLGRIRAQQSFVKAFARQLVSKYKNPKELSKLAAETVETDLSAKELLWLSNVALNIDIQQDVDVNILPGLEANFLENQYYVVNETAALGMINAGYNPYSSPIEQLELNEIGQNLFAGWQWENDISDKGTTEKLDEEGLDDPTRFCEYYYEYDKDLIEDSLFADAMDTPSKLKQSTSAPTVSATQKPKETLSIPRIEPSPQVKDRYIILDPNQNLSEFGIDPGQVEYWTPRPTPTPTPTPTPESTPTPEPVLEEPSEPVGSEIPDIELGENETEFVSGEIETGE